MAGNYDITNVVVNTQRGVDNTTSFTTNSKGKKQFIGTPWNETSYIVNDPNAGTIFEEGKGMTIKANSRYKNGGAATYANLDRKHTGISFDLLDKFIEAAAKGDLEDLDHQGYTKENMANFGKAFDELRARKLAEGKKDPYKTQYTKMMNGTEFTFTAEEIEELYTAAGFGLRKAEQKPKPPVEPDQPAVQSQPATPVTPAVTPDVKPQDEGDNFKIGTEDQFKGDKAAQVLQAIVDKLGIQDGEVELAIPFGGKDVIDNEGNVTQEIRFTYQGKKYVIQQGSKISDLKLAEDNAGYKVDEEVGQPEVVINGQRYKQRYNAETGTLQRRKVGFGGNLLHKWHDVKAAESVAEPAAQPVKTPEQLSQEVISDAVARFEKGEEVTVPNDAYYVTDDNGNKKMVTTNAAKMVKLADGSYAFKSTNPYLNARGAHYYAVESHVRIGAYNQNEYSLMAGAELEGVQEAE